ncbi:TetR/AcrR family transcriptional regulator [Glycomyces terrestris]|uniref:TetR/AcrR family transcriptional regulator n=1 Tax=Glycomyces terrestris TaxID=2493553 RepID=A0A426V5N2_9ACTN|nr:TetR/AcrR family transcriptional regulator [Glycomyces terrestris]RRS02182.1 TetR/AcrR family transcriptional regulator [Glycomyces terrestris]
MTNPPRPNGVRHGARGQARREEIVRAAMEVIAERGYRGASLAAVAEKVGLTQQGLLHYFPSKEDLLIAVLTMRDQWDRGDRVADGEPMSIEQTVGVVEANAHRPAIIRTFSALLGESVTEDHPAEPYFRERYARVRRQMAATLRGRWGDRLPSGLTPEEAAPLVVAIMDGLQYQWLHDPESIDMPASFRAFLRLVDPEAAA